MSVTNWPWVTRQSLSRHVAPSPALLHSHFTILQWKCFLYNKRWRLLPLRQGCHSAGGKYSPVTVRTLDLSLLLRMGRTVSLLMSTWASLPPGLIWTATVKFHYVLSCEIDCVEVRSVGCGNVAQTLLERSPPGLGSSPVQWRQHHQVSHFTVHSPSSWCAECPPTPCGSLT